MTKRIQEIMTPNPVTLPAEASLIDAAMVMRDADVGDVIVLEDGDICGIVTDRDIIVCGIASGNYPATVTLGEICSRGLATLSPTDSVEDALHLMREKAVRRLPVVEQGQPIGIVSLGDLAIAQTSH